MDRILPFDVIPRVISAREWAAVEAGVIQRVTALNLFLHDIYHDQKILKDGIIPADLVTGNQNFRPQMIGIDVPFNTYVHIMGVDLVRDGQGIFRVLEDNARVPSGVSYVVENRHMMMRAFPDLVSDIGIRPVDNYGVKLLDAMCEVAPADIQDPRSCCCRRARTTRPISSISSWRARWACRWSKGVTSLFATTGST